MEDNVRAHYICYNCDEEYCVFNMQEGQPANCPKCKTTNYPGYEVIPNRFFEENASKIGTSNESKTRFRRVFHEIFRHTVFDINLIKNLVMIENNSKLRDDSKLNISF